MHTGVSGSAASLQHTSGVHSCHYLCSKKLNKVCFIQMKNYGYAKGNPSGKNQFREESCDASSSTDTWEKVALGTG